MAMFVRGWRAGDVAQRQSSVNLVAKVGGSIPLISTCDIYDDGSENRRAVRAWQPSLVSRKTNAPELRPPGAFVILYMAT
jgi:hypothetical protein